MGEACSRAEEFAAGDDIDDLTIENGKVECDDDSDSSDHREQISKALFLVLDGVVRDFVEEGISEGGRHDEEDFYQREGEGSESHVLEACRGGEESSQKHQDDERMEATEKVGQSVLSVFAEDVFDEGEVDVDFEREEVFASVVDFDILSDSAGDHGKHDHTESGNHYPCSGFGGFEGSVFKKQIDRREEDC